MRPQFRLIQCRIERGGFPSERCFTLTDANGDEIIGIANLAHLCGRDRQPLSDEEPPPGKIIDGFVKCRILRKGNDAGTVVVDLPSDEIAIVLESELSEADVAMSY